MSEQLRVQFSGVGLKGFSRDPNKGGEASFSANLTGKVIKQMGWAELRDHEKSVTLEGDLIAQSMVLGAKDTLIDEYEIQVDIQSVNGFQATRRELPGKRGKGYIHELSFKVRFGDSKGCAVLEEYILKVPSGKGSMTVMYTPKAVQETIQANAEAAQATMEHAD